MRLVFATPPAPPESTPPFSRGPHGIHVWPVYISAGLPESALAIEHLAAFLKLHARQDDAKAEVR